MRRRLLFMAPILACVTLAGCTGGPASSAPHHAGPAPRPSRPAGSPGNPQVFSCAAGISSRRGSMPPMPEPGDLAIEQLVIISGKAVTTRSLGFGEHGHYSPFVPGERR